MKTIFGALAMMLGVATTAQAQVEWRWSNVTTYGAGFFADLEFRNSNQYGDPDIWAIYGFSVSAKQNVVDHCAPPVPDCFVSGDVASAIGNVQNSMFYAGNTQWREGYSIMPITNSTLYRLSTPWYTNAYAGSGFNYAGVLGCQVPELPSGFGDYGYRTCAADGYDGWIKARVGLVVYDDLLPEGYYGTDDVDVTFSTFMLAGPNAMQVVPEPATYAMVGFGIAAIAFARRKRRTS